jgi:LTXXQ motif family protein
MMKWILFQIRDRTKTGPTSTPNEERLRHKWVEAFFFKWSTRPDSNWRITDGWLTRQAEVHDDDREDADLASINAKIAELMEAKTQTMRRRYEHLDEMHRVLTDEQKVGYDKGVLK